MSQPGIKRVMRTIAAAVALGAILAGCSDPGLYLDRRDTIALSAGDAVAANAVEQMVDPWPPASGNTNIAFNGQRMQMAIERYRINKVTDPVDPMIAARSRPRRRRRHRPVARKAARPAAQRRPAARANNVLRPVYEAKAMRIGRSRAPGSRPEWSS